MIEQIPASIARDRPMPRSFRVSGVAILLMLVIGCYEQQEVDPQPGTPTDSVDSMTVNGNDVAPKRLRLGSPLRRRFPEVTSVPYEIDTTRGEITGPPFERRPEYDLLERSFVGTHRSGSSKSMGNRVTMVIGRGEEFALYRNLTIVDDSDEHRITIITAQVVSYHVQGMRFKVECQVDGLFRGGRTYPHESDRQPLEAGTLLTLEGNIYIMEEASALTLMGKMSFSGGTEMARSHNRYPATFAMHGWLTR